MVISKVRIDDYPAGVRPILPDHNLKFDIVLQEFEKRSIYYVLGIVPNLINNEDLSYLKTLKYMVPGLHGWDHNYYNWTGSNTTEDISISEMKEGLKRLKALDKPVEHYIPPFNHFEDNTIDNLISCGIKYIHTGSDWNITRDDVTFITPKRYFYGRCYDILPFINILTEDDWICLHLTWQYDAILEKKSVLPYLLDLILEKTNDLSLR